MKHPFHQYPLHLYHAEKAPLVVYNAEDEAKAIADGYTETYIHQEFPKMVGGVTVNSKLEEAALVARAAQGAPAQPEAAGKSKAKAKD